MTKTDFGEHLKREREMRGVSLDEICAATRISTRFLGALENEEWDRLPGGVFNRGFVRAVARFLGLNEEDLVAEYVLAMNQGNPGPAPVARSAGHLTGQQAASRAKTNSLPWMTLAVAFVALLGAGWFGWRWYSERRAQRDFARRVAIETAIPVPPTASVQGTAPGIVQGNVPGELPAALNASTTPAEGSAGPAASPNSSAAPQQMETLELKIEAGKATDVTVISDARKIFEGNMIAGQSRTFQAQTEFKVSTGDAGALVLDLNGETLPPIGPPGHAGNVTLTGRDLKAASGGPH